MKKLLALIVAILVTVGSAYAYNPGDPFNIEETDNVVLKTNVITPFSVYTYDQTDTKFPDVIKGQIREASTMTTDQRVLQIFEMKKEANYTVRLNLHFDNNPVEGVKLFAHWKFSDEQPPTTYTGSTINTNDFNWFGPQTIGWIGLIIDKLDATLATTTGTRTFKCDVIGNYTGL